MKVFTNTFDLAKASPHRFWVTPYSDFKIGIKILAKGEVIDKDFTVKAGAAELTPDEDKIDGFTLYTIKSGDTGFVEYTIEVEDIAEKLKLTQIVTDSTVFEVGGEGGDVPADVATQTWVNSQISDFITEDALTAYYTKSETSSAAELSAAFAGAEAISAFNMSENPVMSKALTLQAARWGETSYDNTYAYQSDDSVNILTSSTLANVGTTVYLNIGHNVRTINQLYGSDFAGSYCQRIDFPKLYGPTTIGDGAFRYIRFNKITLPDYVRHLYGSGTFNSSYLKIIDFGNTRTTVPTLWTPPSSFVAADAKIYVPDALYDTWIAANNWSTIASQIHRHSELEAPYLYSSKVAGGAETGTTGTPAAVNAVKSVYETDWATLSATADTNTFYVVLPDPA